MTRWLVAQPMDYALAGVATCTALEAAVSGRSSTHATSMQATRDATFGSWRKFAALAQFFIFLNKCLLLLLTDPVFWLLSNLNCHVCTRVRKLGAAAFLPKGKGTMRRVYLLGIFLLVPTFVRADVLLTAELPGIQSSQVSGVTTENFNTKSLGLYTTLSTNVGIFTSAGMRILAADQFGGAGGTGNYFVVGSPSGHPTADLALDTGAQQSYLGLWLSALDANNVIQLYSAGNLVASYNAATVYAYLATNPAYFGNPNPPAGRDASEPFAYLNFIGRNGTTFDSVRFSNVGASGLEIDNISIRQAPLDSNTGNPVDGGVSGVPLPSTALAGLALLGGCLAAKKLRAGPVAELPVSRALETISSREPV